MDKKFIKINFMKIPSENKIIGHRFSQMSDKKIKSFDDYLSFLKKSDVILDFESRRKKILDEVKKIAKEFNEKIHQYIVSPKLGKKSGIYGGFALCVFPNN